MTEITPTASNRYRIALPLILMAITFAFSAQPFDGADLAWWEVLARKLGHVTGYMLLALAWMWALEPYVRKPILPGALLALAYACTDEYHQTFVDGRTGTVTDVGIDSIGILIAIGIAIWIRPRTPPGAGLQRSR